MFFGQIRLFAVSLALTESLLCCNTSGGVADSEEKYQLLASANSISVGDSKAEVAGKIKGSWAPVTTNLFLERYPFNRVIPYTNSAVITEWRSSDHASDERPSVLFVVFGNEEKTNVTDVLLWNGEPVQPLVDGVYEKNLRSIKQGDSVDMVYTLLGHPGGDYYRGKDGKWRVKLQYMTHEGRFIDIEVDAANGKVIRKTDVSLDW